MGSFVFIISLFDDANSVLYLWQEGGWTEIKVVSSWWVKPNLKWWKKFRCAGFEPQTFRLLVVDQCGFPKFLQKPYCHVPGASDFLFIDFELHNL